MEFKSVWQFEAVIMQFTLNRKSFLFFLVFTVSFSYLFLNFDIPNFVKFAMTKITAEEAVFYVSPGGSDSNPGTSAKPLKTIQKAVDLAQPGGTVYLMPGNYFQDLVSARNGLVSAPIKITGPADAVVKGGGNGRVAQISHDYIVLSGFTIDGLHGDSGKVEGYRDMLVYVMGTGNKDGVKGFKILGMNIKNARGECVRMKYFSHDNEIANNTIQNCGIQDFRFNGGGKNGEGIYIGTAPEQLYKNPTQDLDGSNNNYIHHNVIETNGNEGIDIKEGSSGNIIEYNKISGQKDPESGGLDSRGDGNIFRYNEVSNSAGAGIRFGGDVYKGVAYGKNNQAYGNKIVNNKYGPFKVQILPQGKICGNILQGNGDDYGNYGSKIDFTSSCGGAADQNPPVSNNTDSGILVDSNSHAVPQYSQIPLTETNASASYLVCSGSSCSEKGFEIVQRLLVKGINSSSFDNRGPGYVCSNTLDGSLDTRWSAFGSGEWVEYDLGDFKTVAFLKIAFHRGDQRQGKFYVDVSANGKDWTRAYIGQSKGDTLSLAKFDFTDISARYVRVVGEGNTENLWNSLTEVQVFGFN